MSTENKHRELLFSVTAKDCKFQATRGSGPGGQHRNKVSTAIRCIHPPSGATGYASDDKSQHRNKRKAFRRMAESKKFITWARMEAARRSGELAKIERKVERAIADDKIKCEIQIEGKWTENNLIDTERE